LSVDFLKQNGLNFAEAALLIRRRPERKGPTKKQEETTQQKSLSFSYFNFVHFIEIYAKKVVFTPAQNRNRLWTKAQT
jgi:hypothetical protein